MTVKSSIFLFMLAAFLLCRAENACGQSAFFMRYEPPDAGALRKNIEESSRILEEATKKRDHKLVIQTSVDLGEMLTAARREREAIEILEPLLKSARDQAEPEDRAWLYLNYATANQYFRRNGRADAYFKKALNFVRKHELENAEHYVLHHYARFLVERGDLGQAEKYFEEALKIRQKLKDKRAESTQNALDRLRQMKAAPVDK